MVDVRCNDAINWLGPPYQDRCNCFLFFLANLDIGWLFKTLLDPK
ncbi:MAG: hypothetical protein ACFFC7_06120 [Candidatus Hermodarchaeota archaeon]